MRRSTEEVRRNRDCFASKISAKKLKSDAAKKAKGNPSEGDFLLLDVRGRQSFALGHIRAALCVPFPELADLMPRLPNDRDLVAYCSNHY
jgi:rhodanese-related sulfurtransferase